MGQTSEGTAIVSDSRWQRLEEATGIVVPATVRCLWDDPDAAEGLDQSGLEVLPLEEMFSGGAPPGLHYDLFPMVGDGCGNYLCARVGPQGELLELVFYEHDDASSCFPVGRTIAEAIVVAEAQCDPEARAIALVSWALDQIPLKPPAVDLLRGALAGDGFAEALLQQGIGAAVLGQPRQRAMQQTRFVVRDPRFLDYYGLEPLLRPLLDAGELWYSLEALPEQAEAALRQDGGGVAQPDFEAAQRAAQRVLGEREDMGWAWIVSADVAGWRGDWKEAGRCVAKAAGCYRHTFGEFGVHHLVGVLPHVAAEDPLVRAFLDPDAKAASDHWRQVAGSAESAGDWPLAWEAWCRHVLHMPTGDLTVESHLDVLFLVAEEGGFHCWQKLCERRLSF